MKRSLLFTILSAVLILLSACRDDPKSNSAKYPEQQHVDISEMPEGVEREANRPFEYPFQLDLNTFTREGFREGCAGDCCSSVSAMRLGDYTLFSDTIDCDFYGKEIRHYLFRGDALIAVHEQEGDMLQIEDEDVQFAITERTIDFENEQTFVRKDTIFPDEPLVGKGDYVQVTFDRSERRDYEKGIDDPREYWNFESAEDFSLYASTTSIDALKTIWFFSHLNPDFDIAILEVYAWQEITAYKTHRIPENALFGYSSRTEGRGTLLYGVLNDGVLQLYRSEENEMLAETPEYVLYLEIDPDVTFERPDHYIVFDPDKGKNRLLFGLDSSEQALYAKYEGQSRHIALEFKEDQSVGKKIVKVYTEMIHGIPHGTYTHTHEGIYDYVTYTTKEGKEVEFTINHDASTIGGSYLDCPLF